MSRKRAGLKSPNIDVEYTRDKIEELKKCATDPIYFMKNYVFIRHPKRGRIKFDLYDFQENLVDTFHKNRFSVVLASRQVGKCVTRDTMVSIARKPVTLIKRMVLRLVDPAQYKKMFT